LFIILISRVQRVYLPSLLHEAQTLVIFFCTRLCTRLSCAEIRKIILRFKTAVPSCGIISRYHACVTRSQMEDMKLHGGLPSEYTSVQRNFRAIVLRLRVPKNLYGEWPETAARFRVHSCLPILYYSLLFTERRNRDFLGEFCSREIRQLRDPLSQQSLTIWRTDRPRASSEWNT